MMLKQPDRRRNMRDIVADLGFRDRREQPAPNLSLVPAPPPPEPPAATPAVPDELVNVLSDAHRRAAEQRLAAEKLLRETLALEQRLSEEMEQARRASDHHLSQQLAASLEAAIAAEKKAAEQCAAWAKKLETIEAEKREAQALKNDDRRAVEAATADIAAAESRLAAARRALEMANAACSESDQRFAVACTAQEAAQREADEAARAVASQREAREHLELQLHEVQKRIAGSSAQAPSLAAVEELREVESRVRVAERRAADFARGAVS
jgi:chromosome segregation ATPase